MIRLMRADMYRIFRGKGIYITLGLMLLLVSLTIFVFRSAIQTGVVVAPEDMDSAMPVVEEVISGSVAAQMALGSMDAMAYYFFLPLIIIVAMAAFTSGAVKNELSTGISRTRFYL